MLLAVKLVNIIWAGVVMISLIGTFVCSYLLNKKTPKPEGCENVDEMCEGCQITSCPNRKEKIEEDEL